MSDENRTSLKDRFKNISQSLIAGWHVWKPRVQTFLVTVKDRVLIPAFDKIKSNPFSRQKIAALLQSVRGLDREKLRGLGEKIKDKAKAFGQFAQFHLKNPKLLAAKLQQIDVRQWAEKVSNSFQKQGTTFYSTLIAIVLSTFFLSGPLALLIGRFIPEPPTAKMMRTSDKGRAIHSLNDYQVIFTRNLFSSRGIIPGEEATPTGQPQDQGGPPYENDPAL